MQKRIGLKQVVDEIEEIVEGCRAGREDARKRLYTLYAKQLLAVSYRYTGNMDDAYDVLHDGFVKIFTHFSYNGKGMLIGWLSKVVSAQAIDFLRKKKSFDNIYINDESLPDLSDEEAMIEQTGNIPQEVLMKFVAELPDGCRTVFNLYVFEEKSHKEIAQLLHIKEHSSTSQLHRAKTILMEKIKAYKNYG